MFVGRGALFGKYFLCQAPQQLASLADLSLEILLTDFTLAATARRLDNDLTLYSPF